MSSLNRQGDSYKGVIDVLYGAVYFASPDGTEKKGSIPAEYQGAYSEAWGVLAGSAAEGDDDLLVKFVDEYTLTDDEIKKGLKTAFTSNRIVPVLCGRVIQSSGLTALLDFIAKIGFEPGDALETAVAPDGERASVKVSAEESFSALCVKTVNDQFSGRISS